MNFLRSLGVACAVLVSMVGSALGAEPQRERWFVMNMQGKKAGYALAAQHTENERITSTTSMTLGIKRENMKLSVSVTSEAVEALDGTPISLRSEQRLAAKPMTTLYTWKGDQVEVRAGAAAPEMKPAPTGDWMMPAKMERYVRERLAAGDTTITVKSIEPALGLEPITMTRTIVAREPVEVLGRTVPGIRWKVTVDRPQNLTMEEFTDEAGEPIRSVIDMGILKIEQVLADKDLALREGEAPELLMSTLVKVEKPIENPRQLQRAVYRVSVDEGELPDLPTTAEQAFVRESARSGLLTVGKAVATEKDDSKSAGIGSSHMINKDDAALDELLAKAKLEGLSSLEKAERLRDVVSRHIQKKDLSVGFASSSEALRTKTGDCTEHAVLLAALCRRAGIEARVASGLVYMPEIGDQKNVFGYHMWTQVQTCSGELCWQDVDATFWPGGPLSDATHIAISVSTLGDDDMQNFMVTSAPLIGRMKIEVVEVGGE